MGIGRQEAGQGGAGEIDRVVARAGEADVIHTILINSAGALSLGTGAHVFSVIRGGRIRIVVIGIAPVGDFWIVNVVGESPVQEEIVSGDRLAGERVGNIQRL